MATLLIAFGSLIVVAAALGLWVRHRLSQMKPKRKKALVKKSMNRVYQWCEEVGILEPTRAFDHDYHASYPELRILEDGFEAVRDECLALVGKKDKLTDISSLGGGYTKGGIHVIKWKSFLLKQGVFLDRNCALCPETAALLRRIPSVETAFFSVLDPHQYITPHWGYYRGFARYHLGVLIPNNNADNECYLRVNDDAAVNDARDVTRVGEGEVYHWKNGEGIVFDDNYLHDAANDSDQVRVVLWVDLRRKLPFYLDWFNAICLWLIRNDESWKKIRRNAEVEL
jgi:aspartyl/asparaginyl beta-hydroxylase (cupin superfamily)